MESEIRRAAGISDKVNFSYKPLRDAQYELDNDRLRYMQRMERALDHILDNLDDSDLSEADCAREAGFSPAYFRIIFGKYFEMPFYQLVRKLRLREIAREITSGAYPTEAGKKYGYANPQSLSKEFSKEFGVSPRFFQRAGYDVPDLPLRKSIMGLDLDLEYRHVNAVRVGGTVIDPPRGEDTFMMDACALAYTDDYLRDRDCLSVVERSKSGGLDLAGAWWFDPEEGFKYIFGAIKKRYDSFYREPDEQPQSAYKDVIFQGGRFAVWSYARPKDDRDITLMSRIMWRYVFREWLPANHKTANKLRCTYEVFTADRVYLMLPLQTGFILTKDAAPHQLKIQNWTKYIDEHITDKLSLESLSYMENYSTQNYKEIFSLYYGISPTSYIRRRRIVLAIEELEKAEDNSSRKAILKKYHFATKDVLEFAAQKEFGVSSSELAGKGDAEPGFGGIVDYSNENLKCVLRGVKPKRVLAHSVDEVDTESIPKETVERIIYWLRRDFDDFDEIKRYTAKPEEKVFIWGSEPEIKDLEKIYPYYIGSVIRDDIDEEIIKNITEGRKMHREYIPGGKYAVFYEKQNSGTDPSALFIQLTRYAFGGWINEHRWRTDMSRRTFVIWRKEKLFFYVPVLR